MSKEKIITIRISIIYKLNNIIILYITHGQRITVGTGKLSELNELRMRLKLYLEENLKPYNVYF